MIVYVQIQMKNSNKAELIEPPDGRTLPGPWCQNENFGSFK